MFNFLASAVSEAVATVDQHVESSQGSVAKHTDHLTDLGLPPGEPLRLQTALAWAMAAYSDPAEEATSPLPLIHAEAARRVRALPKHSAIVDKSGASNTR
jgi:hypothetical protein